MSNRLFNIILPAFFLAALSLSVSCNPAKRLENNQYLLRQNKIVLKSDKVITNKGEMKDNLSRLIIPKPNSNSYDMFPFKLPVKLWHYNRRYEELHDKPDTSLPKSVERPVILDTTLIIRSMQNIKSYMFHQGYFYAKMYYKVSFKGKRAFITYTVNAGTNFLINKVNYYIDDSEVARIVRDAADATFFEKGKEYTDGLAEEERTRLTALLRNNGYYKFTQDNTSFLLDTVDKTMFKNVESPFASAINYITTARSNKKPTLDIDVHIRSADDTNAFKKYKIGAVNVFPDYSGRGDVTDSTMTMKSIEGVNFKYHNYYVHPGVLFEHIYLNPGNLFSQNEYDKTYRKLNELGIFQYLRIDARENRENKSILDYNILLGRAKKYDYSTIYEVSQGSSYALGHSLGINFRNRNFLKGANLLTVGVTGGLEYAYNNNGRIDKDFSLLNTFYGVNASLDFPKFLAPIAASLFDNSNLPHTIIGVGRNEIDRRDYFTLLNVSANYSYNWQQSQTITWNLAPAFINVIRLPSTTQAFKDLLAQNAFLKNSYSENFIEGENISFTFDNTVKKHGRNYTYVKLGFEEAGSLLNGINQLGVALNDLYKINFAQYAKFDFDFRHFVTLPHSVFAFRFYGGVGLPYGQSTTLPYIKQYFAGGPYSLRGWHIRTLGPGSSSDTVTQLNLIDRTGDIKLEYNAEYRFPIVPLLAGLIKMNGAIFFDAGNIWLAKKDANYQDGEFQLSTLGQSFAADAGLGARFDVLSFLTVRFDFAVPVKKPDIFYNNGWVIKQIDIYDSHWRSQNIVSQISIGYPF